MQHDRKERGTHPDPVPQLGQEVVYCHCKDPEIICLAKNLSGTHCTHHGLVEVHVIIAVLILICPILQEQILNNLFPMELSHDTYFWAKIGGRIDRTLLSSLRILWHKLRDYSFKNHNGHSLISYCILIHVWRSMRMRVWMMYLLSLEF